MSQQILVPEILVTNNMTPPVTRATNTNQTETDELNTTTIAANQTETEEVSLKSLLD